MSNLFKPERPFEDYTSLRVDKNAKVYAHLDEEEIQAIAKAVHEELISKNPLPRCLRCRGTGIDPYIDPRLGTEKTS